MKNFLVCSVLVAAGVVIAAAFILSLAARRISLIKLNHNTASR